MQQLEPTRQTTLYVGYKGELEGYYFQHWEVPRLEVMAEQPNRCWERLWSGERWRWQRCQLELADGVSYPFSVPDGHRCPSRRYRVRLQGTVVEEGRFGHMGWCSWRVVVTTFENVEELAGQ